MTVVLVHGVPETSAVWDLLVEQLVDLGHKTPIRLSPPGFGAPMPAGWSATVDDYHSWLVAELEAIGHPVHLVGHDWGGGHVLNVAMTRPDLILSWVCDVPGLFDLDYVWHDLAQQWQRAGAGEQAVAEMTAKSADGRAAYLVEAGMGPTAAAAIAPAIDDGMGSCILRLYRSAAQPVMADLGGHLEQARVRPGLALLPTEDHLVGTDEQRYRASARAGARVQLLDGLSHWWMTHEPRRAAGLLADFWSTQPNQETTPPIPRAGDRSLR